MEGGQLRITGELELHGVKKEVSFDAELLGEGDRGERFGQRIGFEGSLTIDRREFARSRRCSHREIWNQNNGNVQRSGEFAAVTVATDASKRIGFVRVVWGGESHPGPNPKHPALQTVLILRTFQHSVTCCRNSLRLVQCFRSCWDCSHNLLWTTSTFIENPPD